MSQVPGERLREKPEERFAAPQHMFDLHAMLKALRAEPHPAQHGRRQETIYHHEAVTLILFSFEEGGSLPDHQANGTVTIQALEGRLQVQAGEEAYTLQPGNMVLLAPNIRHSVTATEQSALLVTVSRESRAG